MINFAETAYDDIRHGQYLEICFEVKFGWSLLVVWSADFFYLPRMNNNTQLHNEDCLKIMSELEDDSVDVVCTDPPYMYLHHKLDKPFDEKQFFQQCKRVLKPNGFIIIFGRGASFYRWGAELDSLGFNFKEEIIWDKQHGSSPLNPLYRCHETVSIWSKGKGKINRVKVPYIEAKEHNIDSIIDDVKRLRSTYSNAKSLEAVQLFLQNNAHNYYGRKRKVSKTSVSSAIKNVDRCASVANSMENGCNEKSIIRQVRDHYTAIHPTQKPVRLLERLLALVISGDDLIFDPFMGSGSTGIAALNLGCHFIGCEIDADYFNSAKERIYK